MCMSGMLFANKAHEGHRARVELSNTAINSGSLVAHLLLAALMQAAAMTAGMP